MTIELVKQLITEFEDSKVFKMKVEIDDIKLELEKEGTQQVVTTVAAAPVAPVSAPVSPETNEPVVPPLKGTPVKSPLVGVFYPSSSPEADPYVRVGDHVTKGQVLCIVEAMKVMNEIKAPIDGTVTSIFASNEDLVEYDQTIMIIEG